MITEILANKAITDDSDVFEAVPFNMPKSYRGIISFEVANFIGSIGASVTLAVEGRLSSLMDWNQVDLTGSVSTAVLNDSTDIKIFEDIQVFPQMRAQVVSESGMNSCNLKIKVSN